MLKYVGEAFVSSSIQIILDKLVSGVLNLVVGKKLDDGLVQKLKNSLCTAEVVLEDAERKQFTDLKVNEWLGNLKHVIYMADDLIDHISTKTAKGKLGNDDEVISMLENTLSILESILKDKDSLGLKEIAVDTSLWRTSTSLEGSSIIYGRDQDKEAVLDLLLHDNDAEISVIPIVGMGGVGKTTLAQHVYNHDRIKQMFDVQAWACVSDDFNEFKVTKDILGSVTGIDHDKEANKELVHRKLKESLIGKKFFIVLDDVWTEDYNSWISLMTPLQYGAKGSKILVTTRSDKVASMVRPFQSYFLELLSDDDCWSVFANNANLPNSIQSGEDMGLQIIGREIVRKCKGLPLAAQSLGGLLRGSRDTRVWNNLLHSNIWETESKIIPALRISYQHLPPSLKCCFVYCSLFPKDHKFEREELILLWMAEGLLQPPNNRITLEEVGYAYFNDLVSKSFFQRSCSGSPYYVMHDLVHDLAMFIGGEFYIREEGLERETKIISAKTRHLSFTILSDMVSENFGTSGRPKYLRTYFSICPEAGYTSFKLWILDSKYLRVLSTTSFTFFNNMLPNSIGELIHLRYLDLSGQTIKTLPDTLCNLYNLQTLKLANCGQLTKLPNKMHNLVKLRHLDLEETYIEEMPSHMSELSDLQHLTYFRVGKHEDKGINQLGPLSNLHGTLSIIGLQNVTNSYEASEVKMMDKKYLDELEFIWYEEFDTDEYNDNSVDAQKNDDGDNSEMDIFGKLHPATNLKWLVIDGYRGELFPKWVGDPSYHNLTKLRLRNCEKCCIFPPIGQLTSLKELEVHGMSMLRTIGCPYGTGTLFFPSLESLEFRNMPRWEKWYHPQELHDYFPVLKSLVIDDCPKLQEGLPTCLPAVETIEISDCSLLASSLPRTPAIRKLDIMGSNKVSLSHSLSLQELRIHRYDESEEAREVVITLPTSLQILEITNWSSVISFVGDCLPTSLNRLSIMGCRNLDFPKQNHQQQSLRYLSLDGSCDSLTTLPLGIFPNLDHLEIKNCRNIESISTKNFSNLSSFTISNCPKFVSFPREGLSAPNLKSLHVYSCVNLKSLPCHLNTLLPKLHEMEIFKCPEMETFPEGGMLPSMRTLKIQNCEKLLRSIWITSMSMLTRLEIQSPCVGVKSFPIEGSPLLLPSLTHLDIREMSSLQTLECTGLLHLTSLKNLAIVNCPKLENMEGERLPASLTYLAIEGCPLLGEQCCMKRPQIWPKISHIKVIRVDGKWMDSGSLN